MSNLTFSRECRITYPPKGPEYDIIILFRSTDAFFETCLAEGEVDIPKERTYMEGLIKETLRNYLLLISGNLKAGERLSAEQIVYGEDAPVYEGDAIVTVWVRGGDLTLHSNSLPGEAVRQGAVFDEVVTGLFEKLAVAAMSEEPDPEPAPEEAPQPVPEQKTFIPEETSGITHIGVFDYKQKEAYAEKFAGRLISIDVARVQKCFTKTGQTYYEFTAPYGNGISKFPYGRELNIFDDNEKMNQYHPDIMSWLRTHTEGGPYIRPLKLIVAVSVNDKGIWFNVQGIRAEE